MPLRQRVAINCCVSGSGNGKQARPLGSSPARGGGVAGLGLIGELSGVCLGQEEENDFHCHLDVVHHAGGGEKASSRTGRRLRQAEARVGADVVLEIEAYPSPAVEAAFDAAPEVEAEPPFPPLFSSTEC